jgi:NADH-quinone oxidoreductase subunit A
MDASYAPIFLMFALALAVVLGFFGAGHFLGPKNPSAEKSMPFESGNPSPGARNVKLSVKFYLTAIAFVVFDIEAIFLYVWAAHFRSLGWGGLLSMASFLGLLVVGLVYALKKGALEWEK